MSEQQKSTHQHDAGGEGPQPEPIRFFGTTWVERDGGYGLRRAGVAAGALTAAVAGGFLLRLAHEGLLIAEVGGFVNILVIVMFAACNALAFGKTWESFGRRPRGGEGPDSLRSLRAIGFVGVLAAYGLRALTEAPGEKLHRAEYESALAQYAKRRSARTGNPAARSRTRSAKPRRG